MVRLSEHFERKEQSHHSDWVKQQRWFIKSRQDKKQRADAEQKHDDEVLASAIEAVIATQTQLQGFEVRLDEYDESIVAALMDNQILLDEIGQRLMDVEADLAPLFDDPHANNVMDDGRRVFLTADRSQAYDEIGQEIGSEEYDYDLFGADAAPVDPYIGHLKLRGELIQSRTEALEARQNIYEFEESVADARLESTSGEMTQDRLEELSAELDDLMPPEIGIHMSGYEPPAEALNLTSEFAKPARPLVEPLVNAAINTLEFT